MGDDQDLPIALRRTPRVKVGAAGLSSSSRLSATNTVSEVNARTPKRQSKKRVRFSDPGPNIEHPDAPSATGLTPMVRRTSLGVAPSPKRRRHSAPLSRLQSGGEDEPYSNDSGNEIRFFSLRQVLDDRVKRRIRRNGLSEEMHIISQEKRKRVQKQEAELQRLQHQLEEKDQEIDRLQNTTVAQDTDRILELEQEVQSLREELSSRTSSNGDQTRNYDWTLAARDPFSDSYMDHDDDRDDENDNDDEAFGDTTMADLICSTPSKNRASASFPTPPCTSPTNPATPCSLRRSTPVTPRSHIGIQTVLPDPEKAALEVELESLRLELTKLAKVLESHEALKTRIANKLNATDACTEPSKDIETHLDAVLQSLSNRTAALLSLNSSLSSLGFAGNDAGEIVTSLTGAFRSARLELEYLTPGEITLPLSSRGAEVLDLVLVQLRNLARQVRENEDAIDEYHELEVSLRQQLNARVDAMDSMRERSRVDLAGKDERISDLEVSLERLKGAADGYRRDVAELESLVQSMEEESKATEKRLTAEVAGAQAELADSKATIVKLEAKLASVREQAENFRLQLAEVQRRKAAEIKALNKYHGMTLAVRDERVTDLRRAVDEVNSSLHEAHTTIQQLRVENLGLNQCLDEERNRAVQAVDTMKAELERIVRMSSEFLAMPLRSSTSSSAKSWRSPAKSVAGRAAGGEDTATPDDGPPRSGACFSGELAKISRGTKRRKHDSGLGLLDEDEADSVGLA
ncbi:hypothetical protein Daesc_006003 [Daldinia eschscholtzii]|uniref:Uncharacterized protein n=1 Tax=Daldinia eschscholtzii TaxID=292717 RepID=A0AAX6MM26_9PEZI